MRYKFLQFDFVNEPLESLGKVAFNVFIVAPFLGGLFWGVYEPRSLAGVLGVAFGRGSAGFIKETKPQVQNLLGVRGRAFDLGGNNSTPAPAPAPVQR